LISSGSQQNSWQICNASKREEFIFKKQLLKRKTEEEDDDEGAGTGTSCSVEATIPYI